MMNRAPPSKIIAQLARCPSCGEDVDSDELLPRKKKGLFSSLGRLNPASTAGAIGLAARAYQQSDPNVTFREALEYSLVQTRPGWEDWMVRFISGRLDRVGTPEEMIEVAAAFDEGLRKLKLGL